jgi:hypothetical protein
MESDAESISCFGIKDGGRRPFEAGCHVWKAVICSKGAIEKLIAF